MSKLYSARQILQGLKKLGFIKISQKGSHIKMRGLLGGELRTAIIPNHKQIAKGTLNSILKQANITKQELENAI